MSGRAGTWVVVGAALALLGAGCTRERGALVVTGGTLIDGTGAPPVADAVLVIEDGRIACAGPAGACEPPPGARRLGAEGMWVIPGLFDAHTHPRWRGTPERTLRDSRLRFLLGVTSVRDASTVGNFPANIEIEPRTRDPAWPVPRLSVSGRVTPEARTTAIARRAVEALTAAGASAIKLKDPLPDSILVEIVRAADSIGVPVYGHAWDERPVRSTVPAAVDAGFSGLAHLLGIAPLALSEDYLTHPPVRMGDPGWSVWRRSLWVDADADSLARVARHLAARGVWIEPLLVTESLWADSYGLPVGLHRLLEVPFIVRRLQLPQDRLDAAQTDRVRLRESMDRMRTFVREFHDAGGMLVAGTDDVLAPGLALHEELRQLVLAGLTPGEALATATRNAALAVGVADSLGTLEVGKIADLLVLEGNPLDDIANAQLVYAVVKGGVPYDPASLLEDLADDLRDRTTGPALRLLVGVLAMLLVLALAALAIRRHAASRPSSWRA